MHRPEVSQENYERVREFGQMGDSFDDALGRALDAAESETKMLRTGAPAEAQESDAWDEAVEAAREAFERARGKR